ncbi:MAG: L-proline glycine betaine binding ABC transporter protein ProX [uncultured Acidimicrobiales bacterium]|uniref:L-proline glycine betaine binding ABC transporter protein ProX n=1 Tax=uncultured Acidimicrobiales bacterium TaxID=310071 RepID=A0A6J4H179_9ACTN|nr:MAG: L-proline glycine betaine binding ABC transporter protein ProX [uncultured Acidimicrobiales bacterium]
MRRTRSGAVGAFALTFMLLLGACGGSDDDGVTAGQSESKGTCAGFKGTEELTVGGTNFSEQEIVAELYAQCLQAAGYKVDTKLKLGAREVVQPALERGDIDILPEYVGTLLTYLNGSPTTDLPKTLSDLKASLAPKRLVVLTPAPAEDKNGFAVTKATADRLKLKKLSDLQPHAKDLVFGGGPECPERPLCLQGLEKTYDLKFKEVKRLDSGGPLTKDALQKGDIQVGLIFTSDGAVPARNFLVLEDDKKLQPVDNVVPIVRQDVLKGDVEPLLNSISAKLTTEGLSELNKRVDVDKADPDDVARDWLKANGFT